MSKKILFKAVCVLSISSCLYGANEMNSFDYLKDKFQVIRNARIPDGVPLPTEETIAAIEEKYHVKLHTSHREFLLNVSNLNLTGYDPFRAHKGLDSTLAQQIEESELPKEWIPFCNSGSGPVYFVHSATGEAALFELYPEVEKTEETYASLQKLVELFWPK